MNPNETQTAAPGVLPILFVNYHGTIGGGQHHLVRLLEGLDRTRFAVHVVCCQDGPFIDFLRERGYAPILIPFGKGKLRYLTVSIRAIYRLFKLIQQLGIRVVHVSGLQEAKLASYPAAWAKVPMVWVVAP
jgi:hypothetical protein